MSGRVKIVRLYPELLNLYGDGGNVTALLRRCEWRGIEAEVVAVRFGERVDLRDADLLYLGGGTDREQAMAREGLWGAAAELRAYVEDGGATLAVCGGYELMGTSCVLGDETVEGFGVIDARAERGEERLVGNVLLETELCGEPVVGYENHVGRMYLGESARPFGRVVRGSGNDASSGHEGCVHRNLVGTYVHGPLLPKNPGVADWLLARALERRGGAPVELAPLDDGVELAANRVMAQRIRAGEE